MCVVYEEREESSVTYIAEVVRTRQKDATQGQSIVRRPKRTLVFRSRTGGQPTGSPDMFGMKNSRILGEVRGGCIVREVDE